MSRPVAMVRLGGRRVLLSGHKEDGVYKLGFTPSSKPLLTAEDVAACKPDPDVILEFHDREAIEALLEIMKDMYRHSREPAWRGVWYPRRTWRADHDEQ